MGMNVPSGDPVWVAASSFNSRYTVAASAGLVLHEKPELKSAEMKDSEGNVIKAEFGSQIHPSNIERSNMTDDLILQMIGFPVEATGECVTGFIIVPKEREADVDELPKAPKLNA